MGLVDDETIRTREYLPESLVPKREVRTEQMVIDDHQVRRLGAAASLDQRYPPGVQPGVKLVIKDNGRKMAVTTSHVQHWRRERKTVRRFSTYSSMVGSLPIWFGVP